MTKKSDNLSKYGIQIIRYYNNEIIGNLDAVSEDLKERTKRRKIELNM